MLLSSTSLSEFVLFLINNLLQHHCIISLHSPPFEFLSFSPPLCPFSNSCYSLFLVVTVTHTHTHTCSVQHYIILQLANQFLISNQLPPSWGKTYYPAFFTPWLLVVLCLGIGPCQFFCFCFSMPISVVLVQVFFSYHTVGALCLSFSVLLGHTVLQFSFQWRSLKLKFRIVVQIFFSIEANDFFISCSLNFDQY